MDATIGLRTRHVGIIVAMEASDVARFIVLGLTFVSAGCGRSNYGRGDASADVGLDARAPVVLVDAASPSDSRDVFTPIDAFTPRDVFAPDVFAAPDAFTPRDASTLGSRPLVLCRSTSLNGELANFDRIGSIGTGPFTFETWVKTVDTSVSVMVGYRDPGEIGFLFGMYGGSPFVQLRSVPNITVSRVVNDNIWHHVAIRRDGAGNLSALVDFTNGALDFVVSTRDIDSVSSRLTIGADSATAGESPYVGQLRLVRIWNRRLSDEEVVSYAQTVLGPTTNLLFELPLDDADSNIQETRSGVIVPISETSARPMDCIPSL